MKGVDFSWSRPGGAAIAAAGYEFVLRYVPYPGDSGKGLTLAEVADYRAHGLSIGLVFESTAGRMFDGYPAGQWDAKQCQQSGAQLGFPKLLPFYFACDVDTTPDQLAYVDDYLRGCASVLGKQLTGVYGEYDVIEHCLNVSDTARYGWQTYAWSGGKVHPSNSLYQYLNGQTLNGGEVDLNEAYGNAGLWTTEDDMPDPRVDALINDMIAMKLAVFAGSEQGDVSRAKRIDYANYKMAEMADTPKQSVNDAAQSALALAVKGTGAVAPGMTQAEIEAVIAEELRQARIVIGGD